LKKSNNGFFCGMFKSFCFSGEVVKANDP
jgi:hypothetical protein